MLNARYTPYASSNLSQTLTLLSGVPLCCFISLSALLPVSAQPSAQPQDANRVPAYDPLSDPRIDRREHPNAPRETRPPSLLNMGFQEGPPEPVHPVFLKFAAWLQKYRAAANKAELLAEGVNLAKMRRSALSELIKKNPQRALEWKISQENRALLPPEILAHLETSVAGCGEFNVLIILSPREGPQNPQAGKPSTGTLAGALRGARSGKTMTRQAILGDKIYQAYVYGWRRSLTTKYNIPLQGIAVDDSLAIDINPARVLAPGEMPPAGAKIGNPDRKCLLCGSDFRAAANRQAADEAGLVAQIGNTYYFFDSRNHLHQVIEKMIEMQLKMALSSAVFAMNH